MSEPLVTPLGGDLWRVEWSDDGKLIDNVFAHKGKPKVVVMTNVDGDIILFTKPARGKGEEVGRYNERWAGDEVPCPDSHDPNPVPEDEWVTD